MAASAPPSDRHAIVDRPRVMAADDPLVKAGFFRAGDVVRGCAVCDDRVAAYLKGRRN